MAGSTAKAPQVGVTGGAPVGEAQQVGPRAEADHGRLAGVVGGDGIVQLGQLAEVVAGLGDVPREEVRAVARVAVELDGAGGAQVDEDPLVRRVGVARVAAHEAAPALRDQPVLHGDERRGRGVARRVDEPEVERLDHRGVEEAAARGELLDALHERAVRRAQVGQERVARLLPGGEVGGGALRVARRRRQPRGGAEPVGRGDGGVGEVLLLAVPVHLPDGRVGRDEPRALLQLHQHVGDLGLDHRPPRRERGRVAAGGHVLVQLPEEQAEAVELDVGPVGVGVAPLGAVAVVAHHADLVGPAHVALVAPHLGAHLEGDGRLGLRVVLAADEAHRRVGHVAHPGDVPLPGRHAGEDLPLAAARLLHLAHAQDDLRLEVDGGLGRAGARGRRRRPRLPSRDLVGEQLGGRAPRDPGVHRGERGRSRWRRARGR